MLNFLAAKKSTPQDERGAPGEKRYTRFATQESGTSPQRIPTAPRPVKPAMATEPTTRMVHRHVKPEAVAAATVSTPAPAPFDENAHLYASSSIPVSVLERALPMRFARLKNTAEVSVAR